MPDKNFESVEKVLAKCGVTFYQLVGVRRNADAVKIQDAITKRTDQIRSAGKLDEEKKERLTTLMDAAGAILLTMSEKEVYDKTLSTRRELATDYSLLLDQLAMANHYQRDILRHTSAIEALDHEYEDARREMDELKKSQAEGRGFALSGKRLTKLGLLSTDLDGKSRKLRGELEPLREHLGHALDVIRRGTLLAHPPMEAPLSRFEMRWAELDAAMEREAATNSVDLDTDIDALLAQCSSPQATPANGPGFQQWAPIQSSPSQPKPQQKAADHDFVMSEDAANCEIVMSEDVSAEDVKMSEDTVSGPEVAMSDAVAITQPTHISQPAAPMTMAIAMQVDDSVDIEYPAVLNMLKRQRKVSGSDMAPSKRRCKGLEVLPVRQIVLRKIVPHMRPRHRGSDHDEKVADIKFQLSLYEAWSSIDWAPLDAIRTRAATAAAAAAASTSSRKRSGSEWEGTEKVVKKAKKECDPIPSVPAPVLPAPVVPAPVILAPVVPAPIVPAPVATPSQEDRPSTPFKLGKRMRKATAIYGDRGEDQDETEYHASKKFMTRKSTSVEGDAVFRWVGALPCWFDNEKLNADFAAAAFARTLGQTVSSRFNARPKGCPMSRCPGIVKRRV